MRTIFSELLIVVLSCVVALAAAQRTIAAKANNPKLVAHGTESSVETITVTAKPRSEPLAKFDSKTDLFRDHQSGCGIPPHIRFVPVPLDTNQVYTFTVVQRKMGGSGRFPTLTLTELLKVQLAGQTLYDIEVCEAHKTRMAHADVPIRYGYIPGSPEPRDPAGRPALPHHREYKLGGCVVWPEAPKTGKVYVCDECKKDFENWKEKAAKARDAANAAYRKKLFEEEGVPLPAEPRPPTR